MTYINEGYRVDLLIDQDKKMSSTFIIPPKPKRVRMKAEASFESSSDILRPDNLLYSQGRPYPLFSDSFLSSAPFQSSDTEIKAIRKVAPKPRNKV